MIIFASLLTGLLRKNKKRKAEIADLQEELAGKEAANDFTPPLGTSSAEDSPSYVPVSANNAVSPAPNSIAATGTSDTNNTPIIIGGILLLVGIIIYLVVSKPAKKNGKA